VLGELLSLFVRDTRIRLQGIREALTSADAEARRQAAHALKGSAGNMGARRVALFAARLERADAVLEDLERLEREVDVAVALLRKRFA
jgi:HPt (histidine-containing phosphotransfer) domain-containing protein